MNIPFIKYSKIWLVLSIIIAVASVWAIATWGLRFGIDFTGGSLMEISFAKNRPTTEQIQNTLGTIDLKNVMVQKTGEDALIIRTALLSEADHQKTWKTLQDAFQADGNTMIENRFEMVGPSISNQLRQRSLWAIILVCLGILAYIAYAFRVVTRPVASWKYGALAIIAMLHDVLLVIGVFALLGRYFGVEIDTAFVVAILTILGFSVHDTIVVYDRIREKLLHRTAQTFEEVVNAGLNSTLARSINTTVTTLITLTAMYIFGGVSIHYFVLALLIGFTTGAYSSIFIAAPLLVYVERWQRRKAA
ncbi:MAG: protein translocase subunit SecF [Patescibacteria group bacterium]|nr:protein translocase subunit SecF [Patescibacteria group bacterium]